MSVVDDFRDAMIAASAKRVTRTDKNKGAYVPDVDQRDVLRRAGFEPVDSSDERLIPIQIAGTDRILESTYYESVRAGSGRRPEPRMGRAIIHWVDIDDVLWMGTDGTTVFVFKESDVPETAQLLFEDPNEDVDSTNFVEKLFDKVTLERLLAVVRRRASRITSSTQFERDPAIRAFAKLRSGYRCEMPDCDYLGFEKPNGETYIEVHHIVSLANEGGDVINNVVAVCPNCHKMAHYSNRVDEIREQLLQVVSEANSEFLARLELD